MGEIAEKKRPYAIRIFCRKPISDPGELLEEFLKDRIFFDEDLKVKQVNLDVFESFIATRFHGMIHTDDLVFYDKNLKKVYRS